MKVSYFEQFSDDEIRDIRNNLVSKNLVDLPEKLKDYVEIENVQIGNQITRINRCITLLDKSIVYRFTNK